MATRQQGRANTANFGFASIRKIAGGVALALAVSVGAQAATVSAFSEDFEGTLAAWTDRTPANPQAIIVADPLRAGNNVLSFTTLGSAGSIFTTDFIATTGSFTVSFDYLGLPSRIDLDDLGGFFGISTNFNPQSYGVDHDWIAGTGSFPAPIHLIDDGEWRTYNLTFNSRIGQPVHLMFEDYAGSGPVAGDVYFDNIRFNDAQVAPAPLPNNVPEPPTLALIGFVGIAAGLGRMRKRRRNTSA